MSQNKSMEYLRFLNTRINIRALAVICGYSYDVLRRIFRDNSLTPRQEKKIKRNLSIWVEDVLDGLQSMDEE